MISCPYCNNPPTYNSISIVTLHFCKPCSAEFIAYKNNVKSTSLYTTINSNLYKISCFFKAISLYLINSPGIPGVSYNQEITYIMPLKIDFSTLTPLNVNNKISTILSFI